MNEIEKELFIKQMKEGNKNGVISDLEEMIREATIQRDKTLKKLEEAKNPPKAKEVDPQQKVLDFDKLSYKERLNFYKENPSEYDKLVVKAEKFSKLSYTERYKLYDTDPERYEKLLLEGE